MAGTPLQRINLTEFQYRAFLKKEERMTDDWKHTGINKVKYADPVTYEGNISIPYGNATARMFGLDTNYTHVLVMDDPDTDIKEHGLITWKGDDYDITAVRPSINYLSVALRKRTRNTVNANGG